jgi:hypothetical protein
MINQHPHYYTLKENVLFKYKNPVFFETGTYLGDSVELALKVGFSKINSIEIEEYLQKENTIKFQQQINEGKVELITGDTILVMEDIIKNLDKPTTFWLDAHVDRGITGVKKCPLYEELNFIAKSNIKTHTILIDDVRLFGSGNWGKGIIMEEIKTKILQINPNYNITFEDGHIPYDILVAHI